MSTALLSARARVSTPILHNADELTDQLGGNGPGGGDAARRTGPGRNPARRPSIAIAATAGRAALTDGGLATPDNIRTNRAIPDAERVE